MRIYRDVLAGNIGEALVCTATGLAIAIGLLATVSWILVRHTRDNRDADAD